MSSSKRYLNPNEEEEEETPRQGPGFPVFRDEDNQRMDARRPQFVTEEVIRPRNSRPSSVEADGKENSGVNRKLEKQCSKRKAKCNDSSCPSKQKTDSPKNDLANIILKGSSENIRLVQQCLTRYESNMTGLQHSLLIGCDDTAAGFPILYVWLLELGFTPTLGNPNHFTMELPRSKISALKAALSKHTIDMHPKLPPDEFREKPKSKRTCSSKKPSGSSSSSSSSSKNRSNKKKSSSSQNKSKGLHKTKSSILREKEDMGDVSLSLCMDEADSMATNGHSQLPVSYPAPSSRPSIINKPMKTFGAGGGAGGSKGFSVNSFGAQVQGATSPRTRAKALKEQQACTQEEEEEEEEEEDVEKEDAESLTARLTKSNVREHDEILQGASNEQLSISIESHDDSEASFGAARPLSTSALPRVSYSPSHLKNSCGPSTTPAGSSEGFPREGHRPLRPRSVSDCVTGLSVTGPSVNRRNGRKAPVNCLPRKSPRTSRDSTPSPQLFCNWTGGPPRGEEEGDEREEEDEEDEEEERELALRAVKEEDKPRLRPRSSSSSSSGSESVTKRLNSMALNSATKSNNGVSSFASLSSPAPTLTRVYPPIPHGELIRGSSSVEDLNELNDDNEHGIALTVLNPRPSLSRASSGVSDSADSVLDQSEGDVVGKDEHSGHSGTGSGFIRFGTGTQSLLHSPGFMSDGSSGFTPPPAPSNLAVPRQKPRQSQPSSSQEFRKWNDSYEEIEDIFPGRQEDDDKEDNNVKEEDRKIDEGEETEEDDYESDEAYDNEEEDDEEGVAAEDFTSERISYSQDPPPKGTNLYRTKSAPPRPSGRSRSKKIPRTPQTTKAFSQGTPSAGPGENLVPHAGNNFSTPNALSTGIHISGQPGNDLLVTTEAFDFEIQKFRDVLNAKPPKSPHVRESTSPYLFSALSNRHMTDSGGSYAGSDEKKAAKDKKNKAFLRRMSSSGHKGGPIGSSFNPSNSSKAKKDRKSIISNEANIVQADSKVHWDDLDTQGGHASLDTHSFRGVVIGGTYENCFDDNVPVVSAPSAYDKRVVGVKLLPTATSSSTSSSSFSLQLFVVMASSKTERQVKSVNLGPHWVCYKISTGGFLVARCEILPFQSLMCYFLPKHPKKWAIDTAKKAHLSPKLGNYGLASVGMTSPKSFMDASIVDCDTFHDETRHRDHDSHDDSHHHLVSSTLNHFVTDESNIFPEEELEVDHDQYADDQYNQALCRQLHVSLGTPTSTSSNYDGHNNIHPPKTLFSCHDEDDDDDIICMQQATQMTQYTDNVEGHITDDEDEDNALDMSINALRIDDDDDEIAIYDSDYQDEVEDESALSDVGTVDWNNATLLSNVLPFLLQSAPPSSVLLDDLSVVSKAWALECFKIRAAELSRPGACQGLDDDGWVRFMMEYGDGKFLSAGACKDVFCVYPSSYSIPSFSLMSQHVNPSAQFQAVSVMDMVDMRERDVAESISRELEISMLCSSLVSLNICPNLLQVYSIFQSEYPPSMQLWKRGKNKGKKKQASFPSSQPNLSEDVVMQALNQLRGQQGEYQYIRMEFCSSGDLEEVVRKRKSFDAVVVRSLLFQMCFALYSCREQLSMRHYDVKLLNFFSTGAESLLSNSEDEDIIESNAMRLDESGDSHMGLLDDLHSVEYIDVGFGEHVYSLPLHGNGSAQKQQQSLVKLADFGTSCVGASTLSLPITVHQFTTLENTPPEYLFLGSHARECYSADTFCLGLSFLHLLSGEEPYEEHLKDVRCPDLLQSRLKKLWRTNNCKSQYRVIAEVMESLDTPNDSSKEAQDIQNVLYDTFYRYLVLFDLDISSSVATSPSSDYHDESGGHLGYPYPPSNPVLKDTIDCLGLDAASLNGRLNRAKRECIQRFNKDRAEWSLHFGSNEVMKRVRDNLSLLGEGSLDLLCGMVNLDSSKRCSLHEAITGPLFHAMRQEETGNYTDRQKNGRSFMHYKNNQFLPIF